MIQTDQPDNKGTGGHDHTDPTTREGSSGDSPKRWPNKIRHSVQRRKEQAEQELRMWIEEAKYKLYIRQLSMEESNVDTGTDESKYPFLD